MATRKQLIKGNTNRLSIRYDRAVEWHLFVFKIHQTHSHADKTANGSYLAQVNLKIMTGMMEMMGRQQARQPPQSVVRFVSLAVSPSLQWPTWCLASSLMPWLTDWRTSWLCTLMIEHNFDKLWIMNYWFILFSSLFSVCFCDKIFNH